MLFNSLTPVSSSKAKINHKIPEEIKQISDSTNQRTSLSSSAAKSRINSSKSYVIFNKINTILNVNNRKRSSINNNKLASNNRTMSHINKNTLSKINLNAQSNVINLIRLSSPDLSTSNNLVKLNQIEQKAEPEQLNKIIDFDSIKRKNLNKDHNDQNRINNSNINNNNNGTNKKLNQQQLDLASFISLDNYCQKAFFKNNKRKTGKNKNKIKNYLYYYYYKKILETKHKNNNLKKNGLLLFLLEDGDDYDDEDGKFVKKHNNNYNEFKLLKNNKKLIRNHRKEKEESDPKTTKPFVLVNGNCDFNYFSDSNNTGNNVNDINKTNNNKLFQENLNSSITIKNNNNSNSTINNYCLHENNINFKNNQREILAFKNKQKNILIEGENFKDLKQPKSAHFLCNSNAFSASSSLESIDLIYYDDVNDNDYNDRDLKEVELEKDQENQTVIGKNYETDFDVLNNSINNLSIKENNKPRQILSNPTETSEMIKLKLNSHHNNNKQTSVLNNVTDYLIIKNKLRNVNNEISSSSSDLNKTNNESKNDVKTIEIINKITDNNEEIKQILLENAKAAKMMENKNDFLKVGGQRMESFTPGLRKKLLSNRENLKNNISFKTPDMNMISLLANKTRMNSELAFIRKCVHESFEKIEKNNNSSSEELNNKNNNESLELADTVLQFQENKKPLANEILTYNDRLDLKQKSIILENFIINKLAQETNTNSIEIDDEQDETKPAGTFASNQINSFYEKNSNCNINNSNIANSKMILNNTNNYLNKSLSLNYNNNNNKLKNFLIDETNQTNISVLSSNKSTISSTDISTKLIKNIRNSNQYKNKNYKYKQPDQKILSKINPNTSIMYVNFLNNLTTNTDDEISMTTKTITKNTNNLNRSMFFNKNYSRASELTDLVITNSTKNTNNSRCSSSSINESMNKNKLSQISNDGSVNIATASSSDLKIPKITAPDNNKRALNNRSMKINQINRPIKIKCFDSFNEMSISKPSNGTTSISPFKKPSLNTNSNILNASLMTNKINKSNRLINKYSKTPDLLKQSIVKGEHELTKAKLIYANSASSTSHLINQHNNIFAELNNEKNIDINNLNLEYQRVDSIMSEYERQSRCSTPSSARQLKFNNFHSHQTLRQIEFMQKELQVRKLKKEILNQLKNNLSTLNQSSFEFHTSVIDHLSNTNSSNNNFNLYKFYARNQL